MPNTINGVGKPIFRVLDSSLNTVNEYTFPRCNIGGLEETVTKSAVTHTTWLEESIIQKVKGYRTSFTLDYSGILLGTYCLYLSELLGYEQDNLTIMFNPKIDNLNRWFDWVFTDDPISNKLLPAGGGGFKAMQGIVIKGISRNLSRVDWRNVDDAALSLFNQTAA